MELITCYRHPEWQQSERCRSLIAMVANGVSLKEAGRRHSIHASEVMRIFSEELAPLPVDPHGGMFAAMRKSGALWRDIEWQWGPGSPAARRIERLWWLTIYENKRRKEIYEGLTSANERVV